MFRLLASCVKKHKGAKLFNYCKCCCKNDKKNLHRLMHKYLIIAYAYVNRRFITIYNNICTIIQFLLMLV
jgi:hypothetical protein